MKRIAFAAALAGLCAILCQKLPSQGFPSELYSTPRKFLLRPLADMRLFVCGSSVLDDRIKRGVCVIDFIVGTTNVSRHPYEPAVGSGQPLEEVLRSQKLVPVSRQIRLFKANSIQQDFPLSQEAKNAIRKAIVEAGDIIVLVPPE
jgi:hypothetical protein